MHDWTLNGVKAADQLSLPRSIAVLERDYFHRALEQFGGAVEATFATTGLICKLSFVLQESSPTLAPDVTGTQPKVLAAD